jgi:hypothetical protein
MIRGSGPVAWIPGIAAADLGAAELITLVFPGMAPKVNSIAMVPILGHAVFRGRSVRDGAARLGPDAANLAHGPRTPEQPEKP